METNLKQYFPMIREREAVLADIRESTALTEVFYGWKEEQREEFLNFCTGVRGMKILYDVFFKEIFDPETAPERLNALLSTLLKQKVEIVGQLPDDSPRLADETSLLIMDIVVRLQDGSICNVEVQKIGYLFPGQRSACYSADLLLRQYRRMRGEKQKQFRYRDIKPVYTIVFFENSPKEFHEFPDIYYHYFYPKSDTGLKLELLQNYLFIPLDIFREIQHNNGIRNELEAWLTFLLADEPDAIVRLIGDWPEFKPMYIQLYDICLNTERLMEMFSKELRELDRNTVQFMIDEMQEELDSQAKELKQNAEELNRKDEKLKQNAEELSRKDEELKRNAEELSRKDKVIENGIRTLIESYREMGACRKKAAEKAASAYAMSAEEADQYVKKYWKD